MLLTVQLVEMIVMLMLSAAILLGGYLLVNAAKVIQEMEEIAQVNITTYII